MTDRETLAALIARVEQATGPDRRLDDDIAHAMGWPGDAFMPGRPWVKISLRYTGSLDAAASLVPDGWRWSLDYTQRPRFQDCGCASLFAPGSGFDPPDVPEVFAATPALALTLAALRAKMEDLP